MDCFYATEQRVRTAGAGMEDGLVVEAMGTRYGVVKTKLENGRWTHWLKIPYIDYD